MFQSINDAVEHHAKTRPNNLAYQWLERGEDETESITFVELKQFCDKVCDSLSVLVEGKEKSNKILIMLKPSLDFIKVFLGCLSSGCVAVPISKYKSSNEMETFKKIIIDSGANIIVVDDSQKTSIAMAFEENGIGDIDVVSIDELMKMSTGNQCRHIASPSDIAFYQYTSGSTGDPKGVMVTHNQIIENQKMIKESFGHNSDTRFVGWLPMFHDMGLIGNVLQPLYLGIPCYLMAPISIVQKPIRWLDAISKYRATTSGGPNFAYDMCVERIQEHKIDCLDLSCWKVAFNGAEPIRAETLKKFTQKFGSVGFKDSAHYPCYGMAEATLLISGSSPDKSPVVSRFLTSGLEDKRAVIASNTSDQSVELVSSGMPANGVRLQIVDPKTKQKLDDGCVGEIWVSGSNVAPGYANKSRLTEESFDVSIKGDATGIGYLCTGDLGFMHQGNLYVTGRLKDLLIIRGRNHYPQDIEATILQGFEVLNNTNSSAFISDNGIQPKTVVVQEINNRDAVSLNLGGLKQEIRIRVSESHGISIDDLVFVKSNSIPKTTSGKIRRKECRRRYESGELVAIS